MESIIRSQLDLSCVFDVLVIGGGNAALCAAITAGEAGAKVLLLESAPVSLRGGNSRHTRNIRYLHSRANAYLSGPYLEDEFFEDLMRITGGETNESLAVLTIRESVTAGVWMEKHGCFFQPPLSGTLHLARTNAHFLGGGKALMNAYYATATNLGVSLLYNAEVVDLEIRDGMFHTAIFQSPDGLRKIHARAVIASSGGFQANLAWLREYWGDAANNFIIRGTPYDTGRVLRALLDRGAKSVGDPQQCHAVAVDGRAPRFDGGIVTRLDCVPFGIVVNRNGHRFVTDHGVHFLLATKFFFC